MVCSHLTPSYVPPLSRARRPTRLTMRRVVLDSKIYRILIGALPKLQRRSIVELRRMQYCEPLPATLRIAKKIA